MCVTDHHGFCVVMAASALCRDLASSGATSGNLLTEMKHTAVGEPVGAKSDSDSSC
jgi:hypothetical protein